MIPVQHRLAIATSPIQTALKQMGCELRVSMPAIVVSFDAGRQVVSVQPAIQEVMRVAAVPTLTTLPILDDVPIGLPCGGGYSLTFPIQPGDECDLVFSDMAFDHWWQSGGVQKQPDGVLYRHDIGDAKAWFGLRNQTRLIPNYSTSSAQLRSDSGNVSIELNADGIAITAPNVHISSPATTADNGGGDAAPVVNMAWLTWFLTNVVPYLAAHGYTGPAPPAISHTTTFEAK